MTVAVGGGGVVAEHLLAVYNWGNSVAHSLDEQLKIHTHTQCRTDWQQLSVMNSSYTEINFVEIIKLILLKNKTCRIF